MMTLALLIASFIAGIIAERWYRRRTERTRIDRAPLRYVDHGPVTTRCSAINDPQQARRYAEGA